MKARWSSVWCVGGVLDGSMCLADCGSGKAWPVVVGCWGTTDGIVGVVLAVAAVQQEVPWQRMSPCSLEAKWSWSSLGP